jgi:hypothetical protein
MEWFSPVVLINGFHLMPLSLDDSLQVTLFRHRFFVCRFLKIYQTKSDLSIDFYVSSLASLSFVRNEKDWYAVFSVDYVDGEARSDGDENSEVIGLHDHKTHKNGGKFLPPFFQLKLTA